MKIASIKEAFEVSINPASKPADKGAATKFLKAHAASAQDWFNSQSYTEEQKFAAPLNRILPPNP